MSAAGTTAAPKGVLTSALESVWGPIETWAEGVESSAVNFLVGLGSSLTSSQFLIIGKAATVFKAQLQAGATQSAAFTAALNELSADEQGELTTVEMNLLTFIITISGTAPAPSTTG